MKTEWFYIFIPIFIQGQYDFNFWYGYFKEQSGHKWEWLYRLLKETADIPVTGFILWLSGWDINLAGSFFTAKLFGWTDAVYIAAWKIFNQGKEYTKGGIWWMWWTPLGWTRNELIYRSISRTPIGVNNLVNDPAAEQYDLYFTGNKDITEFHLFGNWYFKKGVITLKEFQIQLAAGLVLSYLMYHFRVFTSIQNLIKGIF